MTDTPPTTINPDPYPPRSAAALRRQLNWITAAWVFGSVWMWTISGAAMTQFARGLGLPDAGFGLLAALPFLGTLFQLPASWWLESRGGRKAMFIVSLTLARALWVAVALIPWVLADASPTARWGTMLVLIGLSWLLGHLGTPAFMSWLSDLVPRRVRGRYMGLRNAVSMPVALVATLGVGWWLATVEGRGGAVEAELLRVTSLLIGVAGVLGVIDILCFLCVRDPVPRVRKREPEAWGKMLWSPLQDRNFRRYLLYNFTLMLATGFLGQYVWLFVFDEAGLSALQANLLLVAVPMLLRAAAYPVWGRLVDRLGKKPVIMLAGSLFVVGPVGWFLVGPDRLWLGYALTMISPLSWPGLEVANFNVLLGLAETKKGRTGGSAYVAVNAIVVGVGGALSGLIGAVVAGALPAVRWEWTLGPGFVVVVTYHGVLFLISMALRVAALIWAVGMEEPRAVGTRESLRYVSVSLYSNVVQGLFMPGRVIGRAWSWSYKLRQR